MTDQRTPRAIAEEIATKYQARIGCTEAIEAALVSAVDAQRQRDAALARKRARGWQCNTDIAVKIAEDIEQDGRKTT